MEKEPFSMNDYQEEFRQRAEEERRRQETIAYRMGQIMMQTYWQHLNEENERFWHWFNNDRIANDIDSNKKDGY